MSPLSIWALSPQAPLSDSWTMGEEGLGGEGDFALSLCHRSPYSGWAFSVRGAIGTFVHLVGYFALNSYAQSALSLLIISVLFPSRNGD